VQPISNSSHKHSSSHTDGAVPYPAVILACHK
jgi:hypothetical protein